MKFKLEIELGNDAMLDPGDIGAALEDVAQELRNSGFHEFGEPPHAIRDINGNTVGEWEVTR